MRHRVSCYHSRIQIPRAGPHSSLNTERVMPLHKYSSTPSRKSRFLYYDQETLYYSYCCNNKKHHHEKYSLITTKKQQPLIFHLLYSLFPPRLVDSLILVNLQLKTEIKHKNFATEIHVRETFQVAKKFINICLCQELLP